MTENFNTAALQLLAAIGTGNQEQTTEARLTLFNDAMETMGGQLADLKLDADIKALVEATGAESDTAPITALYKFYFMGFYSGIEASLILTGES